MVSALPQIKVVDLSRILAGPWASQMLADLGATVFKIEKPKTGDDTRQWGPPFVHANHSEQAAYFHCANRNKQSIAVDISRAAGQAIIIELVKNADVLIENFKVNSLAKYRLDYASLKALNPRLVYCSITGFGQTGPCANKAGYDAMIQAEGGLMSITGEPDTEPGGKPTKVGVAVTDIMTGLYSCNAILAALMAREHTGLGQYIDMSLFDVQVAMLANQGMNYLVTGNNPPRLGNGHPNIVPYQTFATQDGNIMLSIGNDLQFEKFCTLANCNELTLAHRFNSNQQRVQNRTELLPILAKILAEQTTDYWLTKLTELSIPCGAVNNLAQVFAHQQTKHRQLIKQLPDATGLSIPSIASPINLSATPVQYRSAAPALGQNTIDCLQQLNYSDQQINQLKQQGIIG
jgi:crotonobetainyl-CoA:carnitine CoA-transferase CaiB-like acyl-CoA transferase